MKQHGNIRTCRYIILLGIFLVSGGVPSASYGGSATLQWDPPTHNTDGSLLTDLAGYRIYYGKKAKPFLNYETVIDAGLTDTPNSPGYIVNNLTERSEYFFVVTAYNTLRSESTPSEERSKVILSPAVINTTPPITPHISIATASLSETAVGASYGSTLAASGGTLPYVWKITSGLPPGINLIPDTGQILGIPSKAGNWQFSVTATDVNGLSVTKSLAIMVHPAPDLTTSSVMNLYQGNLNTEVKFVVSGGIAPYTWSITSGLLPPGLILNTQNGTVSGIPSQPGIYTFILEVSDIYGLKSFSTYRWAILALPPGNVDFRAPGSENRVDGYDLIALDIAFGTMKDSPGWTPLADLNGDGIINDIDFSILQNNFGSSEKP